MCTVGEAEKLPSDPKSARRLNDLVLKLYNLSPEDAVTWLNETKRFKDMAPAVVAIAGNLADEGDVDAAISSLESLDDPELQLSAMLGIYRTQVRSGRYSRSDFAAAGFSPQEIEFIFLGD